MLTVKQQEEVRLAISASKDGNELVKKILWFLLKMSEGGTKEVCLTLEQEVNGYSAAEIRSAADSLSMMCSTTGSTHVCELLASKGSEMLFSFHYGNLDPSTGGLDTEGQFGFRPGIKFPQNCLDNIRPLRYTFWLSPRFHSHTATQFVVSKEILDAIDLKKPELQNEDRVSEATTA